MSASRDTAEEATARIGDRVSAVRTARNVRVSELAREAGVSASLISQIERGHSRPSVATLFALARALDVAVDSFFAEADTTAEAVPASTGVNRRAGAAPGGPSAGAPEPLRSDEATNGAAARRPRDRHVVHRTERAQIEIRGGVRWERLTPTALDGVEFLELVYAPGAESDSQAYRHPGIELVLVTQGTMTIYLGFEQHDLIPGDSIAFPSSTPHRYVNHADVEARAITVILRDDLSMLPLRDDKAADDVNARPPDTPWRVRSDESVDSSAADRA